MVTWYDKDDPLDWADGWPRYYLDLGRAKLEIEAFLQKRGKWDDQKSKWLEVYPDLVQGNYKPVTRE